MKPVLMDKSQRELSIGTGFIKNGYILRKLQVRRRKGVQATEGSKINVFVTLFRLVHNFLNIGAFLISFAPFESSRSPLSNGAKITKNGSILRKLQTNQVDIVTEGWFLDGVSSDILRISHLRKSTQRLEKRRFM